jgi:hypothetical protein
MTLQISVVAELDPKNTLSIKLSDYTLNKLKLNMLMFILLSKSYNLLIEIN